MLANANPVEIAPASRTVREFLAVYARHDVPFGAMDCLPVLLRRLHSDKHLAMHFWSAVASLTEKHGASASEVLSAIVEASTAHMPEEFREAGPAHALVLDRVERMLAGQDIAVDDLPHLTPAPRPRPEAVVAPPAVAAPQPEEEAVLPIRRRAAATRSRGVPRRAALAEALEPVANEADEPNQVAERSARLVLVPDTAPDVPQPATSAVAEPVATAPVTTSPVERAPLTRVAVPVSERIAEPTADERPRAEAIPLSSYTERTPPQRFSAAALIGILASVFVVAGGIVIVRNGGGIFDRIGTALHAGYDSGVASWHSEPPQPAAAAPAPVSASTQSASVVSQPAQSKPTPPAAAAVSSMPAPAAHLGPQPKPSAATPITTPAQRMEAKAARIEAQEAAAAQPSSPDAAPVEVPEATMNSHLVVSRVPVVPEDVRARGITGAVRLQATINRDGYVSRLHVLSGATELRRPALEAVSAWRYRPYLVNGDPAPVTTTITVDFSSLE